MRPFSPTALILAVCAVGACSSSNPKPFGADVDAPLPSPAGADASPGPSAGDPGGGFDDTQGTSVGPETCVATKVAAKKSPIDIVIIIDTSGSMSEEIVQLRQNINAFASSVGQSGLDYRVIMIAARGTSTYQVCVPPPLGGASCASNPPAFTSVNTTVASTDALQILIRTYDAQWRSELRQDSIKVFIPITDDDSTLRAPDFDRQLLAKLPAGMFGDATKRKYIVHSICGWQEGQPIGSTAKCTTAVNAGSQYQALSQLTGGAVESVCKASWAPVFNNLARDIVTRLACDLAVPRPDAGLVDPAKVVVQFTPAGGAQRPLIQVTDPTKCSSVTDGWYYDSNTAPTKILLCPSTCQVVGADTGAQIDVLLGCQAPNPR